jgi:hypothetical protein
MIQICDMTIDLQVCTLYFGAGDKEPQQREPKPSLH